MIADGWGNEVRGKQDIIVSVSNEEAHFVYFSIQDLYAK